VQIICAPLPKAPHQAFVMPHWLFIDGQQPQTEENAVVDRPLVKRQCLMPGAQAAAAQQLRSQQQATSAAATKKAAAGAAAAKGEWGRHPSAPGH
jgi:hypothetical protein